VLEIESRVDFAALQNVLGLLVCFVADGADVGASGGDEKIEWLHPGVAGAFGYDIEEFPVGLALQDEGAAIRLICASPYREFENRWSREWQERYRQVMERADLVRFHLPRVQPRLLPAVKRVDGGPFGASDRHLQWQGRRNTEHD